MAQGKSLIANEIRPLHSNPGRGMMSELAITPTHLCRWEYAEKRSPSEDNSIILVLPEYRVTTIPIT
jgi:hypothetical protein